jgi:hypothetical protein
MLRIDASTKQEQLLERLRASHDAGITVAYVWARHPEPRRAVELVSSVVDEVAGWQ